MEPRHLALPGTVVTSLNLVSTTSKKCCTTYSEKARTPGNWELGLPEARRLVSPERVVAQAGSTPFVKATRVKVDIDATHVNIAAEFWRTNATRECLLRSSKRR